MLGDAENGGFINTTLGRTPAGRWSWICSALCRETGAVANSRSRRPARVGASSFSARVAPASSAKIANSPVPAEGSSTTSADVSPAATLATKPSGRGVENCWRAWLSSERRVWVGRSAATRASMASMAAGVPALARMAEP